MAKFASEIAPNCPDGEHSASREKMEQWLFLDGVDRNRARFPIRDGIKHSPFIFSDITKSPFPIIDHAIPWTERAVYLIVCELFIEECFVHA